MIEILVHWARLGGGLLLIPFIINFSEARVQEYVLPTILEPETTIEQWEEDRRGVILGLFEEYVYGSIPKDKPKLSVGIIEEGEAFEGLAKRKQGIVTLSRNDVDLSLHVLIYTPNTVGPHKTIISYNYEGNHTVASDPEIVPGRVYSKRFLGGTKSFREKDRGIKNERFPVEELIKAGYATISLYYGDVDPDFNDGFINGAHALYPEIEKGEWGSLSAWAWGFSRIVDYIEIDDSLDENRVALFGFSRHGKAGLWALANDERFRVGIIDSSGDGGATLSRRNFGETTWIMTFRFPHWFHKNYHYYSGREDELPVDQHMLLALAAPRPLLISASDRDLWLDFKGEELSVEAAQSVYGLYNSKVLQYILHEGGHEVTKDEWENYISFLNANL